MPLATINKSSEIFGKVVNSDGSCTDPYKSVVSYAELNSANRLGWTFCNDLDVDYIIHSMTQIDGLTFANTWSVDYMTPNSKQTFTIL